jgi:hypothetical protein
LSLHGGDVARVGLLSAIRDRLFRQTNEGGVGDVR